VATIVGREFDINLLEISEGLRKFKSPKGRLNFLEGINKSVIIDDTYNASPQSSLRALETLREMRSDKARKIVVFGNMLELGDVSVEEHKKLGSFIAKSGVDILLSVGSLAENICVGAKNAKMNKNKVFSFSSQKNLLLFLKENLDENDIVLVKGSQGARMERIVKGILKNKESARDLLVRQDDEWVSKR
jgi:UDP-N-acetylmuramoyl-tripeptide--D-alanyl-D-alanine ligase